MDYEALYRHRFKNIDQESRNKVWKVIAVYLNELVGSPKIVLDPACGIGEFINFCPSPERWAADLGMNGSNLDKEVKFLSGDFMNIEFPNEYFEMIYMSNILEHLPSQNSVSDFLGHAHGKLKMQGCIVIMGPNFKYCYKDYFDCADHTTILTHISVEEHLVASGFQIEKIFPKFLPYSFRSRLPSFTVTTRLYLKMPIIWKILGKQFLVVARKV